ncbi:MAG: hypothetical protein QXR59_03870 [Candidatus Bathyarchaeia archaeon]
MLNFIWVKGEIISSRLGELYLSEAEKKKKYYYYGKEEKKAEEVKKRRACKRK